MQSCIYLADDETCIYLVNDEPQDPALCVNPSRLTPPRPATAWISFPSSPQASRNVDTERHAKTNDDRKVPVWNDIVPQSEGAVVFVAIASMEPKN
jgi:hypothetical protein